MLNLADGEAARSVDGFGNGGIDPALDRALGIGMFFRRQFHRADEELRQRVAGVARVERQPLIDDRGIDLNEFAQPAGTEIGEAEVRFQACGYADHGAGGSGRSDR